jgi:hypothetical protein
VDTSVSWNRWYVVTDSEHGSTCSSVWVKDATVDCTAYHVDQYMIEYDAKGDLAVNMKQNLGSVSVRMLRCWTNACTTCAHWVQKHTRVEE